MGWGGGLWGRERLLGASGQGGTGQQFRPASCTVAQVHSNPLPLLPPPPPQVMTVEEMKRRDAYERSQAVKRIQEETERSRQLLEQRTQLQVCVWGGAPCWYQEAGRQGVIVHAAVGQPIHSGAPQYTPSPRMSTAAGPAPAGQHAGLHAAPADCAGSGQLAGWGVGSVHVRLPTTSCSLAGAPGLLDSGVLPSITRRCRDLAVRCRRWRSCRPPKRSSTATA